MPLETKKPVAWQPQNGHTECLRYAHENGCPLNETTFFSAAFRARKECIRYLLKNDCPSGDKDRHREAVMDAIVANMVEAMMGRVVEAAREAVREQASIVIQRRWLEHVYRPNSQSHLVRDLRRDFEGV